MRDDTGERLPLQPVPCVEHLPRDFATAAPDERRQPLLQSSELEPTGRVLHSLEPLRVLVEAGDDLLDAAKGVLLRAGPVDLELSR